MYSTVCYRHDFSRLTVLSKYFPFLFLKILINPRKNQATVTFDDHRSAKKAKEKGREVSSQAPPIEIIHYLKRRRSSDSMMKQPAKPPQPSFSSAEVSVRNPHLVLQHDNCDSDYFIEYIFIMKFYFLEPMKVDEELAAMSGTDAFSYAAPVSVKSATSSRVIGERELRSLPLKKKQARIGLNLFKFAVKSVISNNSIQCITKISKCVACHLSGPAEEGSEGGAEDREEEEEADGCGRGGAGGDHGKAGEREGVAGDDATPRALRSGQVALLSFAQPIYIAPKLK